MSVSAESPPTFQSSLRSRRTEAMPTNSLFGSSLEMLSPEERKRLAHIDLQALEEERAENQRRRGRPDLPQKLKEKLPGDSVLQHSEEQLRQQREQAERARELLGLLDKKSRYFEIHTDAPGETQSPSSGRHASPPQWYSNRDLEHAREINPRQLNRSSKNRSKPQVHQYSLMGDVLRKGMDFNDREPTEVPANPATNKHHNSTWGSRTHQSKKSLSRRPEDRDMGSGQGSNILDSLPPNILHKYGANVCRALLADEQKVQETLDSQNSLQRHSTRSQGRGKGMDGGTTCRSREGTAADYKFLGLVLKSNVLPGSNHSYVGLQGTHKRDFTEDVHKHRVPVSDAYRMQRDQLTKWAEQNVLRERVKRAWDAYETRQGEAAETK